MATLLLIDDDPDLLRDRVSHVFPAPAHRVEIAQTGAEGLERVAAACPDVILLDLRLPDQSGLDILRQLRRFDARIPVVMVTVARSSDSAIEAMRHGAYDYLLKPIDLQKLDHVINEALKVSRLMREPAIVAETPPDEELSGKAFIGSRPGMQEAYKAIGRGADQTFPVPPEWNSLTPCYAQSFSSGDRGDFRHNLFWHRGCKTLNKTNNLF